VTRLLLEERSIVASTASLQQGKFTFLVAKRKSAFP